jgi:predicted TIM-barrel fold metal-dependent hydrolase
LTSDFVSECVDRYEDRLVGFAGLDITNVDAAVAEVRHAVFDLRLTGVAIDPFRLNTGADDRRLDPIYELCQELHVPIIITLGGWPGIPTSLRHAHPLTVDDVAGRFPALTLIATHGAWPFTQDMVAVAWRRENVYFDNSPFHHAPGAGVLVDAAETMVGHKMLYASAYPFAPLAESLDRFCELPFDESVMANVLYGNADRLLRKITADREAVGIPVRPYPGGDRHDEG